MGCSGNIYLTFKRRLYLRKNVGNTFEQLDLSGFCACVDAFFAPVEHEIVSVVRTFDEVAESWRSEFFYVFIRIFSAFHAEYPCPQTNVREVFYRFLSSRSASAVAVVGHHYFIAVMADKSRLIGSYRSTQRSHNILKASLIHGDNVHIPLAEDKAFGVRIFGEVH